MNESEFSPALVDHPASERHVLVVDDDPRLLRLLGRYLGEHGYRVSTAVDAAEARAALAGIAVDAIVLDIMMPGESGLDLTADLSKRSGGPPILLLSAMAEADDRINGLERGAEDYLAKPFEPRELLLRLDRMLRRLEPPVAAEAPPGEWLRLGELSFDVVRGDLHRGAERVRLTPGEAALLQVLVDRRGEVVERDALSEAAGIAGGERTVDVHMTRLRRKIEDDPRYPRFLQTVRGRGYRLVPDG